MASRSWISLGAVFVACTLAAAPLRAQSFAQDGAISAGADALYWTRGKLQRGEYLTDGVDSLKPSDLRLGWEPGVEGWLTLQKADSPLGLDLRYFWLNDFSDQAGALLDSGGFLGIVPAEISFASSLQGAEASATCQMNEWLSISGGFRWLQANDVFSTEIDAGIGPAGYYSARFGANNDLYGGQLGANIALIDNDFFRLNLLTKLGLYHNDHAFNYDVTFFGPSIALDRDGSDLAFSTDARLGGTWWLTSNILFNAGYQVLLIDGVLRAETVTLSSTIDPLKANDTLVYHGAYFGFTIVR